VGGELHMICGKRKNGCVILVKRFIDIPPYLKWDRGGAAFHKCKGYDCTVIVWSPEYAPEWWKYPETIE
jgi:hypothetical protein